jgi:hypothetical protein
MKVVNASLAQLTALSAITLILVTVLVNQVTSMKKVIAFPNVVKAIGKMD